MSKFNTLKFKSSGFVHVAIEVYRASVFVSINQTDKQLEQVFKEWDLDPKHVREIIDRTSRETFTFGLCTHHEEAGVILIRLFNPIRTPDDIATLAHEALHATIRLLDTKRMKLKRSTEETFTYIMDYIVGTTLEQLTHIPCSKTSPLTTTTPSSGPTLNSRRGRTSVSS